MAETYKRWRLPQLWEMVAADDAANTHLHLATLRRQQTALETQRDQLRTLRDHLTEGWPPTKSQAATAFADMVNDMIDAMTGAARGAGEVRAALTHIVNVIQESRSTLAALVAEYDKASKTPDPRIGQHAKLQLDQRARDALISADGTVLKALGLLDVPLPQYARFSTQRVLPASAPASAPGGAPGGTRPGGTGSGGSGGAPPVTTTLAALSAPRFDPPVPATDDDDLTLASQQASGVSGDSAPMSSVPAQTRGGEPLTYPVIGIPGGQRAATSRPGGAPMIGGSAPAGSSQSGGTAAAMRGQTATNAPLGRLAGGAAHRDQPADGLSARRRGARADTDSAWSVPEGVRPVLEAEPPTAHDPGPGVLGIDR